MDERTLRVLEYDKILKLLEACAACSLGKDRARRLQPETRPEVVAQRLAETTQAAAIIGRYGSLPLSGLTDTSEALARARVQVMLSGPELMAVGQCIGCALRVREYFAAGADLAPDLAALADRLSDQSDLQAEIERCLDDEGQVRRHASERLDRLYGRQAVLEGRTRERLEAILRQAAGRDLLQESIIVQRSGRFCLPVKTERQGQLRGVVHDRSDSGATVFIEPLELVQLGNELREVELEMAEEVRAILRDLSGQVGAVSADLLRDLGQLGTLDYISARGKLSRQQNGVAPGVRLDGVVVLRGARHPLLGKDCVANDFWIGESFDTLLITGPNTGGKTVALKTVGLLVLMAQSGLHVPAEPGSETAVFEQVWADIGDEQSIEQSLSTFSSHMTQIIRLVSRAEAWRRREGEQGGRLNALVLLDELGAGTDPAEGAALGQAILEELHATGCRTIATTHYNDLKVFAYATDGMENASVEFNVSTLQPTFRLLIGQPGSSNALDIAQRLGMPRRLVKRAREYLGGEVLNVEAAIREMKQTRRDLDQQRRQASQAQRDLERLRAEYERNLADLESKRSEALEEGFSEALDIVRRAEEEARRIIADLQRQPRQSRETETGRQEVAALRRTLEKEAQAVTPTAPQPPPPVTGPAAEAVAPAVELEVGQRVRVQSLGREGVIAAHLREGVYLVEVGAMKVETVAGDLVIVAEKISEEARRLATVMHLRKASVFSPEIDLRGATVEEAIAELEKWLDDAQLANVNPVRVLHGKGTGALRAGLQKYLKAHCSVRRLEVAPLSEGGDGVTIVHLK